MRGCPTGWRPSPTFATADRRGAAAGKSVNNVEWSEVQETRGHVENGQVAHFQVVVKVGFRVDT